MSRQLFKPALVALSAALALSATATVTRAAEPASPEVLCLGVYLTMAGESDPATKNAGLMGALYYAGRVQGANPDKDPLDMVIAAMSRPDAERIFLAAAPRCSKEMMDFGQHWIDRGQQLQDAAKADPRGV